MSPADTSDANQSQTALDLLYDFIKNFNDRSTQYLMEDVQNVVDLIRLIRPALAENISIEKAVRENRITISPSLRQREHDVAFRVTYQINQPQKTRRSKKSYEIVVIILVEQQTKKDSSMPLRILVYMVELWVKQWEEYERKKTPMSKRVLAPIIPVVYYLGDQKWEMPIHFRDMFPSSPELASFIPDWETLSLDLQNTSKERLSTDLSLISRALLAWKEEKSSLQEFIIALEQAVQGLDILSEEERRPFVVLIQFLRLLVVHRRPSEEHDALLRFLADQERMVKLESGKEFDMAVKTMIDVWKEEAEKKGREIGREEGREEEREATTRSLLIDLFSSKFETISEKSEKILNEAGLKLLEFWFHNTVRKNYQSVEEVLQEQFLVEMIETLKEENESPTIEAE